MICDNNYNYKSSKSESSRETDQSLEDYKSKISSNGTLVAMLCNGIELHCIALLRSIIRSEITLISFDLIHRNNKKCLDS